MQSDHHCFLLSFSSIIIVKTQAPYIMISKCVTSRNATCISVITDLIITITIFSDLIGASTALFFTNYCVGLISDSEIRQLAVIGYLKSDSYISQPY